VHTTAYAVPLLVLVGLLAGFFVVPMNALLQHRGYVLLSAGHSIAVQNFHENLNILLMLAIYSLLLGTDLGVNVVIWMFGGFVAVMMIGVMLVHARNQRAFDAESLMGIHRPPLEASRPRGPAVARARQRSCQQRALSSCRSRSR